MNTNITIYTASAIDLSKNTEFAGWREELREQLETYGINGVLFDPKNAFKSMNWGSPNLLRSTYIELVNKAALEEASVFVALVDKNAASIGVPIEIDLAHDLGKEMFLLTNIKYGESAYLDNRVSEHEFIYSDLSNVHMSVRLLVDGIMNRLDPKLAHHDFMGIDKFAGVKNV